MMRTFIIYSNISSIFLCFLHCSKFTFCNNQQNTFFHLLCNFIGCRIQQCNSSSILFIQKHNFWRTFIPLFFSYKEWYSSFCNFLTIPSTLAPSRYQRKKSRTTFAVSSSIQVHRLCFFL